MASGISFKVVHNGFPAYTKQAHERLAEVVAKTAQDIEANAKVNVRSVGAIDTGFMLNSIQASTHGEAVQGAASGFKEANGALLDIPEPASDTEAFAGVGAEYGPHVEKGHVTSKGNHVAGRPYFEPAVEFMRDPFEKACQAALKPR